MAQAADTTSFHRIVVIGTGAIGCSVASLVRGHGLAEEVVGVDRVPAHLEMARRLGFIHRGAEDLSRGVMGADGVVLAVPIDEMFITLRQAGRDIRPGAMVTCTAGTTLRVWEQILREIPSLENFVPSFPLVFTSSQGPAAASSALLQDRLCLVGSSDRFAPDSVDRVCSFWSAVGMSTRTVDMEAFEWSVAGRHFWPLLMNSMLREFAAGHGWLDGHAVVAQWLKIITRKIDPGKSYQLHATKLCALLDEFGEELMRMRNRLGGVPVTGEEEVE
jgi:hypothetical protein